MTLRQLNGTHVARTRRSSPKRRLNACLAYRSTHILPMRLYRKGERDRDTISGIHMGE